MPWPSDYKPAPPDRTKCQNTFRQEPALARTGPGDTCGAEPDWLSPLGERYCQECVEDGYPWGLADGQYGWKKVTREASMPEVPPEP